jgi:hypothetical protein
MAIDLHTLGVFRIIHFENLDFILQNGIYYRSSNNFPSNYVNIGNSEIITNRDTIPVKCYPGTYVNEYVPFYFAVKTPMLYNIHTGYGVPQIPQHEIIYLACRTGDIVESNLQWCFTDGNAAKAITEFYRDPKDLEKLDWHSIRTKDFRDDNADGDPDRKRKKHAEFLVKDHVPVAFIKAIFVYNEERFKFVEALVKKYGLDIPVKIDNEHKLYF